MEPSTCLAGQGQRSALQLVSEDCGDPVLAPQFIENEKVGSWGLVELRAPPVGARVPGVHVCAWVRVCVEVVGVPAVWELWNQTCPSIWFCCGMHSLARKPPALPQALVWKWLHAGLGAGAVTLSRPPRVTLLLPTEVRAVGRPRGSRACPEPLKMRPLKRRLGNGAGRRIGLPLIFDAMESGLVGLCCALVSLVLVTGPGGAGSLMTSGWDYIPCVPLLPSCSAHSPPG